MLLNKLSQKLDVKKISWLAPHRGPMVLLDKINSWDDTNLVCQTYSHQNLNNPLRVNNKLSSIATLEYAAQAASYQAVLRSCKKTSPPEGISKLGPISRAYLAIVKDFYFEKIFLEAYTNRVMTIIVKLNCFGPRILNYKFETNLNGQFVSRGEFALILEL